MNLKDELYGLFMDVFRNTGTMPGQDQMTRIYDTCGKISNLFNSATTGQVFFEEYKDKVTEILAGIATKMEEHQKVFDTTQDLINTLRTEHTKLIGQVSRLEEKVRNLSQKG